MSALESSHVDASDYERPAKARRVAGRLAIAGYSVGLSVVAAPTAEWPEAHEFSVRVLDERTTRELTGLGATFREAWGAVLTFVEREVVL